MNWFFLSLIPPTLYAMGNYIDKAILSKHLEGSGVGAITLFSCFLGALTLPFIGFFAPDVLLITPLTASILAANGILTVLAVLSYLYAIERDDISAVVPILQLTPVFGFVSGYFFLHETLNPLQIAGSGIIVMGAVLISLEIEREGISFKKRVLALAALSALLFSLSGTVFKYFALDVGYWRTQFWEYVGIALIGVILFLVATEYRRSFLATFKKNRGTIISLNIAAEAIMVSADLIMNFATLLAPIALIYVVNSFQPVFVFLLGLLITLLFPHIIKESLSKKHVMQKVLTISMMAVGLLMLY